MTSKTLRERHRARPFLPFVLHMADGRNVPVDHPEFMAISPAERTVSVYERDGSHHIIDILMITDLEIRAASQAEDDRQA